MIIQKPIDVPLMTIEDRLDFDESRKKLSEEQKQKYWESKLAFPKDFDMSQWNID